MSRRRTSSPCLRDLSPFCMSFSRRPAASPLKISCVTALCLTCGLESPLPVPSEGDLIAHLGQLPVPQLRRLSAMLDLRIPEARWSVIVKDEVVIHHLAGKLRTTLLAFSIFAERHPLPMRRAGGR